MVFPNCFKHTVEEVCKEVYEHTIRCLLPKMQEYADEEQARQDLLHSPCLFVADGQCYVGITNNPVQSLSAHGIDIFAGNAVTFYCTQIPKEDAQRCKEAVMATDDFEAVTDPANDRTETPYPLLYLYIYRITAHTNEHPELGDMLPMEQPPEYGSLAVRTEDRSGRGEVRYLPEMNEAVCDALMNEFRALIADKQLAKLTVRHRELYTLWAEFGDDCFVICYDSGRSQSGGYECCRSGETSRKKVQLYKGEYPAYAVFRDMQVFERLFRYFLLKGRKPDKRLNIKWAKMKYAGWE